MEQAFDAAKLSTDDAAAICGVSRATIYRYFNLTREPKAEHVAATIEATGCDAKWLLTGIRTAEPEPPRTDYYIDLFTAFLAARTAYEAYERAYQDPSTRHSIPAEITRRVYEAGKRLDKVGGYEAMTGAVYAFYPNDDDRRVAAGTHLNGLWSGIGALRAAARDKTGRDMKAAPKGPLSRSTRQDFYKRDSQANDASGHDPEMAKQFGLELGQVLFGGEGRGIRLGQPLGNGFSRFLIHARICEFAGEFQGVDVQCVCHE